MRHSNNAAHKNHSKNKGIRFILYPFAFLILNVIVIVLVAGPFASPYINMAGLVFMKDKPSFGTETVNIYDGISSIAENANTVHISDIEYPTEGVQYGVLTIESASIDAPLMCGDSNTNLKKGVGSYTGTYLPGQGRTVLIAGHNNSYFKNLKNVEVGAIVNITTNYGQYVYEITDTKIGTWNDSTMYDLEKQEENLILYTCHNSIPYGATPYRQYVYAKYVSGPKLVP